VLCFGFGKALLRIRSEYATQTLHFRGENAAESIFTENIFTTFARTTVSKIHLVEQI
jgi:hypothetical protein